LTGECDECKKKKLVQEETSLIQPKLKIGQPNDKYEQEADRVADEVIQMPEPKVQRQVGAEEEEDEKEVIQTKRTSSNIPATTPAIESGVRSLRQGGGRPLPSNTREFMEARLGHDFGDVRVHTDEWAADVAQLIGARAFTIGNDVVFNTGEFRLDSRPGRQLLAHELTHVVQQYGAEASDIQRKEIDDCGGCSHLDDTTLDVNDFINARLDAARTDAAADVAAASAEGRLPRHLVVFVFKRLGEQVSAGTTPLDEWAEALPPEKAERQDVSKTKFAGASGLVSLGATFARLMRIEDVCIGSDKLGHMTENGFNAFMSSEPIAGGSGGEETALEVGKTEEERMFGLQSTGVFSNADIAANLAGRQLYKDIVDDEGMRFDITNYISPSWNECINPSLFREDVATVVWTNLLSNQTWGGQLLIEGAPADVTVKFKDVEKIETEKELDTPALNLSGAYAYETASQRSEGTFTGRAVLSKAISGREVSPRPDVTEILKWRALGFDIANIPAAFDGVLISFDWTEGAQKGKGQWVNEGETRLTGSWVVGGSRGKGEWNLRAGAALVPLMKPGSRSATTGDTLLEEARRKKGRLVGWVERVEKRNLNPKRLTRLRAHRAKLVFLLDQHGELGVSLSAEVRAKLQAFIDETVVKFEDLRPIEIVGEPQAK
jgi:hypothetical protein